MDGVIKPDWCNDYLIEYVQDDAACIADIEKRIKEVVDGWDRREVDGYARAPGSGEW